MMNTQYKRFYFLSLAVLFLLSAYPLINGVKMAILSIQNGAVEPEQYAKYVVPYAAMCLSVIVFAALQPLLFKLKRLALPVGLFGAFGIFIAAEQFFESIQIHTVGMSLVDASTLEADPNIATTTIDAWQAALCIASPKVLGQSVAYASSDRYFYVMGNNAYKIHYYLIALVLITMVSLLVYGIGRMLRNNDASKQKPLIMQGIATAALLSLCVFANTTAFFRQTGLIQTPLASVLTGLFFVVLGVAVGIYSGSFLLGKKDKLGVGIPVASAVFAVILMYIGEAAMMSGNLYRFGTGWFFEGLPGFTLAPVDLLVILLAGALTWLLIRLVRRIEGWPGRRTAIVAVAVCAIIAVVGVAFSVNPMQPINSQDGDLLGCYEYTDYLFINPVSSFRPPEKGNMHDVYGFGKESMIIANKLTGYIIRLDAQYEKTPVAEDEFRSITDFPAFFKTDLSGYKERWLRGVFTDNNNRQYGLYQMDGEIWLVNLSGNGQLWSIYRLQKTDSTSLDDLERAMKEHEENQTTQQMTMADVYALARKGSDLTFSDFEPFTVEHIGSEFSIKRYDVAASGCTIIIRSNRSGDGLKDVRLVKQGNDPFDDSVTVEMRDGLAAVAAYLNPLYSLRTLKIEDPHRGSGDRELIYTDEHNGYRYFLNTTRADRIFVTFENGDRLPIKQALADRRLIMEDAVANGLGNVFMEPIENPLGGYFPILHHYYIFTFDKEPFFPSASFMYLIEGGLQSDVNGFREYFDINELADNLQWQGKDPIAEKLRDYADSGQLVTIAGKAYVSSEGLHANGISYEIGWAVSSHTPVWFRQE